jgi:ATP-dependent helicase/nuclease subunit A
LQRRSRIESETRDAAAAARGVTLHKLLQELPSVLPEKRIAYAKRIAEKHKIEVMPAEEIARLTLDDRFRELFDARGLAEAPISANLLGGRLPFIGRIDRLVLNENETVIIDYKSGAPLTIDETHDYALQLAKYRAAIEAARTGKPVKAALLWIEVPRLDWIGKDVLDRALARLLASTTS